MNIVFIMYITVLLYLSSIIGYSAENAFASLVETTKVNILGNQTQNIYTAMITKNQEIPVEQTESFGTIIFRESLTRNNTLEYELVIYNVKDITGIFVNYNQTIPIKTIYSNTIIPDICCLSVEGSESVNVYLTGISSNEYRVTPLDLLKSGITLFNGNSEDVQTQLDSNSSFVEIISPSGGTKSLTDLFKSGKAFISIETKSNPDGEIQGQIIDKMQILE
ncbi:CHRD domain-containing protein [Candidatus Nitrosocosmicus hydrocola]|uniref:CHRD domain-containing protein n=1 Tax=Candidatus Nitrosocosmicus hydrocola TaxID=1826872 RepID=UPI0011E5FEE7|nr:CHRD domain-containing protein [Candidatus Nitrosocosmicus hydrocola]